MRRSPRPCEIAALAAFLLPTAVPSTGRAQTTLNLGQAAQYSVFEVSGSSGALSLANSPISGNVGLGAGTTHTFTGSTITGTVTNPVGAQANLDAINASSQAAGLTPTGSIAGNSVNSVGGNVTFNGQAGQNVVDLTGISLTNATFTINGTSAETFIFNVSGGITLSSSTIKLNGVGADRILFNVTGVGHSVALTNSTSNGTFLDLNGSIAISGGTTTGAVISEGAITIAGDPFTGSPMVVAPELPTILMGGLAGLLVLGKVGLDRLRHRRAAMAVRRP
jgi:hypothetical protein